MARKKNALDALVIPRRGPQQARNGAGIHADRRTRRVRDRGAAKRAAIREGM